jgi:hypothetical protein
VVIIIFRESNREPIHSRRPAYLLTFTFVVFSCQYCVQAPKHGWPYHSISDRIELFSIERCQPVTDALSCHLSRDKADHATGPEINGVFINRIFCTIKYVGFDRFVDRRDSISYYCASN